jgi:hypothetical protein
MKYKITARRTTHTPVFPQDAFLGENPMFKQLTKILFYEKREATWNGPIVPFLELVWKIWTSQKAVLSDKLLGSCR